MPPVEYLADYLDLIAAIEDTAAHLQMPVVIEGYTPPYDPRIAVLKVTPDPGVIEVNIHPASSWEELVENTTALYDLARQTRLGHREIHAGRTAFRHRRRQSRGDRRHERRRQPVPAPSRFAAQHGRLLAEPSVAVVSVFGDLFIGPTSQHPRVDEARTDSLYELEIAFEQIPDKGAPNIPPWLVDRIFRNLLTDLTGNTHRAEFCIDKLYPPEAASKAAGPGRAARLRNAAARAHEPGPATPGAGARSRSSGATHTSEKLV